MADGFELKRGGDDEKVKSTEKLTGNILGGFVKSTRSSARSYRDNGAAEMGKLELGDGVRVAVATARDKQRRGLGMGRWDAGHRLI
jgi:hypothetical protein